MLPVPPALLAPPPTVPQVDLARYMGDWFEIARLPNPFQRKCVRTTARYILGSDLHFKVLNACLTAEGERLEAHGRATLYDRASRTLKEWLGWLEGAQSGPGAPAGAPS